MMIGHYGASNALVTIDGPDSEIRNLDYIGIGYDASSSFSQPGGHGALRLNNGAQITTGIDGMRVGTGGTVGGWNGTINGGEIVLTGGGQIDLRDGQFGSFVVNSDVFVNGPGNSLFLDMGAGFFDADTITLNDDFLSGPGQACYYGQCNRRLILPLAMSASRHER